MHVKKLDVLNILNHRPPFTTVSLKQFSTNVNVMVFPFFSLLQYKTDVKCAGDTLERRDVIRPCRSQSFVFTKYRLTLKKKKIKNVYHILKK